MSIRHIAVLGVFGTAISISTGTGCAQGAGATANKATVDQDSKGSDTSESSSFVDYIKRTVQLQASARARIESTQGDFSATPSDVYVLSRIRLGIGYKPNSWLRFYVESQDSRAYNYKTSPPSTLDNPFDLRQAYVEAGALEGNGVKIRFGRQDLQLGSGRLVASGEWSNVTKTYSLINGYYKSADFKMDLLGGSQVLIDPTRMDRDKPGEHLYGIYTAFPKLLPGASIEPYLLAKTQLNIKGKDNVLGNGDTLYMGGRVIGLVTGGFDYNFEGVRQGGSYADDSIRAFGYVGGGGWTIPRVGWKLHVNTDYLYGSGDSGLKNGKHESFDILYGPNQPLNSLTGQFCWRNAEQWRAGVDFFPVKKLKVKVDYRDYWLATVKDGLYNGSGTRTLLNAKATSNHLGEGVDTLFTYVMTPKTTFTLGIGTLDPGTYLKESGKKSAFVYPSFAFARTL